MRRILWISLSLVWAVGCSRTQASSGPHEAAKADAAAPPTTTDSGSDLGTPGSKPCAKVAGAPACLKFASPEDAFRFVLSKDPLILAVGEAHAQKGTESLASSTKRFTEVLLPILAPRASDIVVELWAPDPKCIKEVKKVATAQKPVTDVQASTNQNEYVVLGTKAKEAGMTPWLLRPTCDDFAMLADAGADTVSASLGLIKRLTQSKITQLYDRNKASSPPQKVVVAYGGALHNDLAPTEAMRDYSFGPELDLLAAKRYIELDLIVPEYVKASPAWEKLPWYAAFEAEKAAAGLEGNTTVYATGPQSFVLVFPPSSAP